MNKIFLIAEGDTDIAILRKLIPEQYAKGVKFVAGKGYSAATSLAGSLLYDKPDIRVVLVLDADTTDPNLIQERYDFLDWQLKRMSFNRSYDIILFVPMIEALFINHNIIEIEQPVSYNPRNTIDKALKKQNISFNDFIQNLSKSDIDRLRKDQAVQTIIEAVQRETVPS